MASKVIIAELLKVGDELDVDGKFKKVSHILEVNSFGFPEYLAFTADQDENDAPVGRFAFDQQVRVKVR